MKKTTHYILIVILLSSFKVNCNRNNFIKNLNGYWDSSTNDCGILFSESKYLIPYCNTGDKRINNTKFGNDIIPHISLFEYEIKSDTITDFGIIKLISRDSISITDFYNVETFFLRSKDTKTPVFIESINKEYSW